MDVREKLVELQLKADIEDETSENTTQHREYIADLMIANGVTVQEQNKEGCPYCDIAKANEGVMNTKLWVKEKETNRWTMMGKRLNFCPMCGQRLPQPPKGE